MLTGKISTLPGGSLGKNMETTAAQKKAARQFENLLWEKVLEAMAKTAGRSETTASQYFNGLFYQELATVLTESSDSQLADTIYRQFQEQMEREKSK